MKITVECTDEERRQAGILQAFAKELDPDVVVSVRNSIADARTELKPCPFCGCNDHRVKIRRVNDGYKVSCGGCGASGPRVAVKAWRDTRFVAQDQAVKVWNRRKK